MRYSKVKTDLERSKIFSIFLRKWENLVIVAIILGSDVVVWGSKNIGLIKVWNIFQRLVNEEENKWKCLIFNCASCFSKVNCEELETIISAIFYEPTIEINNEWPFRYIHGKRKRLPKYLKDFKRKNDDDIKLFEGPKLISYVGPDKNIWVIYYFTVKVRLIVIDAKKVFVILV